MTETDPYYDPEGAQAEYDQNEFERYLSVRSMIFGMISLGLLVILLRHLNGSSTTLPETYTKNTSSGPFQGPDDEVFIMTQRFKGKDRLILYNSTTEQVKDIFVLNYAEKIGMINVYMTSPKVSSDGKIICFCKKATDSFIYTITSFEESTGVFKSLANSDTCNYNFMDDNKGLYFTTLNGKVFSYKFNERKSEQLTTGLKMKPNTFQYNLRIHENRLYYICLNGVYVKELLGSSDAPQLIHKTVHGGNFDISPDWNHLIVIEESNDIAYIYDTKSLKLLATFKPASTERASNNSSFFSSDGSTLYMVRCATPTEDSRLSYSLQDSLKLVKIAYQDIFKTDVEVDSEGTRLVKFKEVKFGKKLILNTNISLKPN